MPDLESAIAYIFLWPVLALDLVCHAIGFLLGFKATKYVPPPPPETASVARGETTKRRGAPRSALEAEVPLLQSYDGHETIHEMIHAAMDRFGARIAMRSRKYVETKKLKETDKFPSKIFDDNSGFEEITYKQLGDRTIQFGSGLRALGLTPIPSLNGQSFDKLSGDFKMVIFENTCPQWTTALLGAFSQSMTVATCYATLGHEAVISAVQETEASALLVNHKDVPAFVQREDDMPSLKLLIASTYEMSDQDRKAFQKWANDKSPKIRIVSTDQVVEMGKQSKDKYEAVPPKVSNSNTAVALTLHCLTLSVCPFLLSLQSSDVAVIMYTSGSTGKPKGVVMTHSQLVAGVAGMAKNVDLRPGEEIFVSYLPLAHILALQIEHVMLSIGATLCYTDPREMSSVLSKYQPTLFVGVPKVYEMLKAGVESKVNKGGVVLRTLFRTLLPWKMWVKRMGGDTPLSNKLFALFSKKVFGKNIRGAVTGGGPISSELQNFIIACFDMPLIQGYALTETCVGGCFQHMGDSRNGVVGPPVSCVEVALQSEPDITDSDGRPYLHSDTKSSHGEPILGRGEICMRGPSISSGYYKNLNKTKEEYDEEGFFHTGDIGQFTQDGVIQIIDRKKNLVKLKGGEYVAVENMETAFGASKYVDALVVIASGNLDTPFAVVCTNNGELRNWADQKGVTYKSLHDLANLPEARREVLSSMKAAGEKAGLSRLELRIKDCCLLPDTEWKPGHGMTASMKIDRKAIHQIHKQEIEEMYDRNGVSP